MKYSTTLATTDSSFASLGYMPQLNSLRAFAALGVFTQHFLDSENLFRSTFRLGDLGVRLFFVLSGFLITGLLLDARRKINHQALTHKKVILYFYVRRFLRLSPIYYLVILFLTLFMVWDPWSQIWWFVTYLQNMLFVLEGRFTLADHFWTLAVEEQFYLFWPFLILLVPRSYLFSTLIACILAGPVCRIIFLSIGLSHFQGSMLMPSHLDTLALGGLLAVAIMDKATDTRRLHTTLNSGFILGCLILGVVLVSKLLGAPSSMEFILSELGAGLVFVWVVHTASVGFTGVLGYFLHHPIFVYLGQISYGMYVIHGFVPDIFDHISWLAFASVYLKNEWIRFLIFSFTSILLAMLSWHVLEKPVHGFRRKFAV